MTKTQLSHALYIASQTLPFLMITSTFIGLAYICGHSFSPYHMDQSFELVRLSCNYIP